ncbi:MAG: hypothetical protein JNM13_07880 [Hyphomicrobiaceae bacterium]|nr:hypothetical protein [Hyphomicrobiaceae bacterium]
MKPEGTTKRLEALDFDQIDDLAKAAWRVAAQQVRACGLEPIGAIAALALVSQEANY